MQPEHVLAPDGSREYWILNGKLHREGAPAYIEYEDGKVTHKGWWIKGLSHREDGPACIEYKDGEIVKEEWWINGDRHRKNGAAWIEYKNGKIILEEWWVNGKELLKEDFTSVEMIDQLKAYRLFSPIEIARMRKM